MSVKKDWSNINKTLVARGSLQLWIPKNIAKLWFAKIPKKAPGRPNLYSDIAIQVALIFQYWLNKPLRQTCGFMAHFFSQSPFNLTIPDYSTLSRRKSNLNIRTGLLAKYLNQKKSCSSLEILLDSTGIKLHGPGHWLSKKHGSKSCKWLKLHLAVNAKTQRIEAWITTTGHTADCTVAIPLIKNIFGSIRKVTADGAYDSSKIRKWLWSCGIGGCFPPQYNARLQSEVPKAYQDNTRTGPHMNARDKAITRTRETGSKKAWMEESGYHKRSLVETAMGRFKGAFGDRISSRKPQNIVVEIAIKIGLLNMWMEQSQVA